MTKMGNLLSKGLRDWVDQGVCPGDVAERIEMSLRSARQRPWWQRWPAVIGAAASVAAIFIVVLATQPHLAQQMASIPLIGGLAAQLVDPDIEIYVDPQKKVAASLFRPTRTVDLSTQTTREGTTLTIQRVATDGKLLRVQYTIKGESLVLLTSDGKGLLLPELRNQAGPVQAHSLTADRRGNEIHFVAYFDAVAEGEKLTLTVPALPAGSDRQQGPWTVSFTN